MFHFSNAEGSVVVPNNDFIICSHSYDSDHTAFLEATLKMRVLKPKFFLATSQLPDPGQSASPGLNCFLNYKNGVHNNTEVIGLL